MYNYVTSITSQHAHRHIIYRVSALQLYHTCTCIILIIAHIYYNMLYGMLYSGVSESERRWYDRIACVSVPNQWEDGDREADDLPEHGYGGDEDDVASDDEPFTNNKHGKQMIISYPVHR